jgi:hypothetical protein
MILGMTARVLRGCLCLALVQPLLNGCRSDDTRNKSVGVPGTLPAAPTELPNDVATPSKANTAAREADSARRAASPDGGLITLTPTALREDTRLHGDSPNPKDSTGVTLEAEWKSGDWPSLPNNSPIERERLSEIHNKTKWLLHIDLVASGRMRITLASRGYAFEKGTEIRSRVDLLGHLLVWPEENQYRILPPGSMRSLFEDGIPDVGPTLATNAKTGGTARWLDWDTERTSVTNSLGHAILDQTTATNAGVAGRLLCRWLIEFINADPASSVCQNDLVPVRAQFNFAGGGKAEFVVTQSTKKQEYTASNVGVPPLGTLLNVRDLPRAAAGNNSLLVEHRSRAVTRPPSAGSTMPNGLVAVNHTLGLRVLVVDGIATAWLLPGEERNLPELLPGAYFISWRDFLGNSVEAPKSVTVPARLTVGTSP